MTPDKSENPLAGPQTDKSRAAAPRRWSDDPWCNMTTGEAEAYRRGWEAACAAVAIHLRAIAEDRDGPEAEFVRLAAGLFEEMEPPA